MIKKNVWSFKDKNSAYALFMCMNFVFSKAFYYSYSRVDLILPTSLNIIYDFTIFRLLDNLKVFVLVSFYITHSIIDNNALILSVISYSRLISMLFLRNFPLVLHESLQNTKYCKAYFSVTSWICVDFNNLEF